MSYQLPLLKERDRVPAVTEHSGKVIDGFRVVTASDMAMARAGVTMARVTGSIGDESYVYEVAGPEVMPEFRNIEHWAIVERITKTE